MSERNYEFRERLLKVHKPGRRDPSRPIGQGEIEIDSSWTIVLENVFDRVLYLAARDLEDYFAVSMGVFVGFNAKSEKRIVYAVDPSMEESSYSLDVSDGSIVLSGHDARCAARAGYLLEDLLNLAEAPFIKPRKVCRRLLYDPRMIHSGFGLDMFPDAHLSAMAHAGFTSILVYVKSLDMDRRGYQDFADIVRRAADRGIDVYAFSVMLSRVYPEGEEGEKFYDSLYGELFRRCPGLKGVLFCGEAIEFPSRDEHTTGKLRLDNIGPDGHRIIKKPSPGWWPCRDYPLWVDTVKKAIYKYNPSADIIFCSYNWGYVEESLRVALIDALPTDISVMAAFEMFEDVPRNGVYGRTVDYTLYFEGPGEYFVSEAKAVKRRGMKLYSETNTAGLCWDVGVIPYYPAPYQWLKRYREMRKAHDEWGLCGTMDSHHYGWTPSFISDFAKWMFESPDSDPEEVLRSFAVRDFSPESADLVLEAWRLFSDAADLLISTDYDQYGPLRVGPAYPLLLNDDFFTFDSPSYAIHGRNEICKPMYGRDFVIPDISDPENRAQFIALRDLFSKSAALFEKGAELIERALVTVPERKRTDAKRQANLSRFIATCIRTAVHTKDWYVLKVDFNAAEGEKKRLIAKKMESIARMEIENALSAIPMVDFDSRLGYEPSMEYMCDERHIRAKIEATERVIEKELGPFLS
ncbi:MAG: hypothetical protein IJV00_10650 [Clostridia bacterium]|nr:hypothetical protein [Clostridia bacterium]